MTDQITKDLGTCYSGVVHDIMRAMGLRNFTLPPEITPQEAYLKFGKF